MAATITLQPPGHNHDLNDLQHAQAYVWNIDNYNFGSIEVNSARLVFNNIYNTAPVSTDRLSVHLLASALPGLTDPAHLKVGTKVGTYSTLYTFWDGDNTGDLFNDGKWGYEDDLFVWENAPPISESNIPTTYATRKTMTYWLSAEEIYVLNGLIANYGKFAVGFDPDCAYKNTGVSMQLNPVPEPATMILVGSSLIGLAGFGRRRYKK
jgi:hypothetical protein